MGVFDNLLEKFENFGYKAANKTHKFAVAGLFLGSLFGFYSLFRDYRGYFLQRKSEEYAEHLKKREELMRKLIEFRDSSKAE
jgi:hypothetical protein